MHRLSAFILTFNSEKYLGEILRMLKKACDEIIVLDSGSSDRTAAITKESGCKFLHRNFDNFKDQRAFAVQSCSNDLVLMIDSDEIPDEALIAAMNKLKQESFICDAYRLRREWFVLGRKVHAAYPVVSPDYPVRLFDRRISNFDRSPVVHEEPSGYQTIDVLGGTLKHYTFETKKEIAEKLDRYTTLSAQTLLNKKKSLSPIQRFLSAAAAFMKWYFGKGGWRDGGVGIIMGIYAYQYTYFKYRKAKRDRISNTESRIPKKIQITKE